MLSSAFNVIKTTVLDYLGVKRRRKKGEGKNVRNKTALLSFDAEVRDVVVVERDTLQVGRQVNPLVRTVDVGVKYVQGSRLDSENVVSQVPVVSGVGVTGHDTWSNNEVLGASLKLFWENLIFVEGLD